MKNAKLLAGALALMVGAGCIYGCSKTEVEAPSPPPPAPNDTSAPTAPPGALGEPKLNPNAAPPGK